MIFPAAPLPSLALHATRTLMHSTLVYPPVAEIRQPYPALPALAAYLRQRSDCTISIVDANIESFEHFTSAERLQQSYDRLWKELTDLDARSSLPLPLQKRYLDILNVIFKGSALAQRCEEAKALMRDRDRFMDEVAYYEAVVLINQGLQLISAEHPPSRLDTSSFAIDGRETFVEGLIKATGDEGCNPFIEFYRTLILPRILAKSPDVVGISIGYIDQLLPGLTLARLLKEETGGEPPYLVAGGAVLLEQQEVLKSDPGLFTHMDGYILHDGEEPLRRLMEALPSGSLREVPRLIHMVDGEIVVNDQGGPTSISDYPTPAYELMPLDRYASPDSVFYLQTSHGCYWNRCAFCTRPVLVPDRSYRKRATDKVIGDIDHLRDTVGARFFAFYDDSVPPATLGRIADHLRDTSPECHWYAEVKFEEIYTRDFLARLKEGGCRLLFFGLESASQPLLDRMEKGVDIRVADRILSDCEALSIPTALGWFVGFPGETLEDHNATLEFIERHHQVILKADPLQFTLYRHSKVYLNPSRYGITRIGTGGRGPLALDAEYDVEPGLIDADQAAGLVKTAAARVGWLGMMGPRTESHLLLAASRSGGANVANPTRDVYMDLRPRMVGRLEKRHLSFSMMEITRSVRHATKRVDELVRSKGRDFRQAFEQQVEAVTPEVANQEQEYYLHLPTRCILGDEEPRVFELCDGSCTVREIMNRLSADPAPMKTDRVFHIIREAMFIGILETDDQAAASATPPSP